MTQTADRKWSKDIENLKEALSKDTDSQGVIELIEKIVQTLNSDFKDLDTKVYSELEGIADYITHAKTELNSIGVEDISAKHLPTASVELDAVVKATEEATGRILDSVEKISEASRDVDPDVQAAILNEVTNIFEACNFQDITGQIISRVLTTMRHVEQKVGDLLGVLGAQPADGKDGAKAEIPKVDELLSGPQIEDAHKQDDIDALFDSLPEK